MFSKNGFTINQQIAQLQDRVLHIPNVELAAKYLSI